MPPAAPSVLIDNELQSKITGLNFDAWAFYEFAVRAGFSDAEIAAYTIHFTQRSRTGLGGKYFIRARKAEIYLGDILQNQPESTGQLQAGEHSLARDEQYSRVLSRVVAHETGHHSRTGRARARLADVGASGLLIAPPATIGLGALYVNSTGNFLPPVVAIVAEITAIALLSYRQAAIYGRRGKHPDPEKLFTHHRRRYSEKPAVAIERQGRDTPLVTISLYA